MIRFIAVVDDNLGLADEHGIPWQGKLPTDIKYFREKTINSVVMMGYATYAEFSKPLSERRNLVASSKAEALREGFELIRDAHKLLKSSTEDIWVIGGAGLFTSTLDLADELYLTRIGDDFHCTKFFPKFEDKFELQSSSETLIENGLTFHFEVWVRR